MPGDRGRRPRAPTCSSTRRRSSTTSATARARRALDRRARRPSSPRDAGVQAARADAPLDALLPARDPRRGARRLPATRSSRATSTRSRSRSPSAASRALVKEDTRHRHEHDRVLPRGGSRPDQQLRRHRRRAPQARAPRGLHHRGVVRRRARGPGLRGAPDAPRPAAGGARGPGPVLEGLHPRDGAGVPQADDRAARRLHRPDVPGADRRRRLRRRPPARDHRRARARRDRRGQRRRLPGAARLRQALGADRLLQSDRGARSRRPAAVLRLPRRRPQPVARLLGRVGAHARGDAREVQRAVRGAGRAAAARARVHARVAVAQPHALSRRGRLPARPPARRHLAQPPDAAFAPPTRRRSSRRSSPAARARSSTCRWARSARPTSS